VSPKATHLGAQPQLRWVCPKRWQRLLSSGSFVALHVFTFTRSPQRLVRDRNVRASRHRHDEMRCQGPFFLCPDPVTVIEVALQPALGCARPAAPLKSQLQACACLFISTQGARIAPPEAKKCESSHPRTNQGTAGRR
jgi:hypothetical protein